MGKKTNQQNTIRKFTHQRKSISGINIARTIYTQYKLLYIYKEKKMKRKKKQIMSLLR